MIAVNPDGTKRWEYPVPGDDKIRALTPDGKKVWECYAATEVNASPSVGPDGTIYLAAWTSGYSLARRDSFTTWSR